MNRIVLVMSCEDSFQIPGSKQGQKFVAVGAESRYSAFTATNRDI